MAAHKVATIIGKCNKSSSLPSIVAMMIAKTTAVAVASTSHNNLHIRRGRTRAMVMAVAMVEASANTTITTRVVIISSTVRLARLMLLRPSKQHLPIK